MFQRFDRILRIGIGRAALGRVRHKLDTDSIAAWEPVVQSAEMPGHALASAASLSPVEFFVFPALPSPQVEGISCLQFHQSPIARSTKAVSLEPVIRQLGGLHLILLKAGARYREHHSAKLCRRLRRGGL